MESREQITNAVTKVVAKVLSYEEKELRPDTNLDVLGADSLSKVEIMLAMEEKFDITFPQDEEVEVKKIEDIAIAVEKILKEK